MHPPRFLLQEATTVTARCAGTHSLQDPRAHVQVTIETSDDEDEDKIAVSPIEFSKPNKDNEDDEDDLPPSFDKSRKENHPASKTLLNLCFCFIV
ncbi:hypothetical protein MVEN_00133100 [Mycena venus]|uniref:Uncharacterized protein n=1 Tax=Mycena venus TaxID=2733690 RepID=A0A8H6Z8F7_9AGAR|nr:hypothetical protein MVEN_00133100 [Mycena venus]